MFDKHVSCRRRKGAKKEQKIGANSRRVFVFVVSNFFSRLIIPLSYVSREYNSVKHHVVRVIWKEMIRPNNYREVPFSNSLTVQYLHP